MPMRNTWVNRCRKSSYKNLTLIRDKNCQHTRMKGASSSWWRAAAHVLWLTAYPTERDGTVPPQDQDEAAFPTSAPRCTGGSSLGVRQGEKLKCIKIGKSKTVLCEDDVIVYRKNPVEFTRQLFELINEVRLQDERLMYKNSLYF